MYIINGVELALTTIIGLFVKGDIIYSDGWNVVINGVEVIVRTATNDLSIVRHSGNHWSLQITHVWIQCPVGYDLRTTNSSAYGVTPFGLRRSFHLDQVTASV